jgi:phosphoribosylanthranilate isomerase
MTRIKICCITSSEEAHIAASNGADALGFVSDMPSGPGVISESEIKNIISGLGPFVLPVLLTSKNTAADISVQYNYCCPGAFQLCEPMTEKELRKLTKLLPAVPLIRVIHVSGPESLEEAKFYEPFINAFLLDTGQRSGRLKQLGGTGKTHDWSLSTEIVKSVKIPVILAGGLNAQNVKQAIEYVKPYAVDVCSGVRTNNRLDPVKLSEFISIVRASN